MAKVFNLSARKMAQGYGPAQPIAAAPLPDPMAGTPGMGGAIDGVEAPPADGSEGGDKFDLASLAEAMKADPFATIEKLHNYVTADHVLQWNDANGQPVSGRSEEVLKPDTWNTMQDEQERAGFLGAILDALPAEMRAEDTMTGSELPATFDTAKIPGSVQAAVRNSNDTIRKMAQEFVSKFGKNGQKKASGRFNLLKQAQSRVGQGNTVFGPTNQFFPSVNQIGNDWHIMERNKGWGHKAHEFVGIDYEMVWRRHIMDKFYSDYRDKDGKWVGGYLNKRFEIDRNVSDVNNMQLKPGQIRKPILPEYGNLGSRMEAKHEEDGKGKVFNWNKAHSTQVVKTAMTEEDLKKKVALAYKGMEPLKPITAPGAPSTSSKPAKMVWNCAGCNALNGSGAICQSCGLPKGSQPTAFATPGKANKPGQMPSYNKPPQTPTHIKKNSPLSATASVLSEQNEKPDDKEEEKDEDDALDEGFEFKQVLSEPQPVHSQFSDVLKHHQRVKKDFDALGGGPEQAMTPVQPMIR